MLPFSLQRALLLLRGMRVDRDRPDLERLASVGDPERFVWAMLPHAARTFSACIVLLPAEVARGAAVAYLYCRMLDTYEDLLPGAEARDAALRRFAVRLMPPVTPAPAIEESTARDDRDRTHLLLVERHALVDRLYERLPAAQQGLIRKLVRDMGDGMRWSTATFERQAGVLEDEEQLSRYCRNVLGHPVLFATRLLHHQQSGTTALPPEVEEDAMTVGELIQLANVTRDIEKDLARGIAYHPALRDDLGRRPREQGDAGLEERVRRVREELMLQALRRAPAYRRLVRFLGPSGISLARASAVLMLLFTDQYFRRCARRAGRRSWGERRTAGRLIAAAIPAAWSRRWSDRLLAAIERDFLAATGPGH